MELEGFLSPVTALAFFRLEHLYLLAGENNYLRVFDHDSRNLLFTKKLFTAEAIHGIYCFSLEVNHTKFEKIVAYGGRSICLLEASSGTGDQDLDLKITATEIYADDWILDARIVGAPNATETNRAYSLVNLAITAHNNLLFLDNSPSSNFKPELRRFRSLARGPRSILYSAHIASRDTQKIIVASGTVTGEILVWSVLREGSDDSQAKCQVHYTLPGHEGSVFGVRISNPNQPRGGPSCVLASCSDDRNILVWDVSGVDGFNPEAKPAGNLLAKTVAHTSRIWAVQVLPGPGESHHLMSFGEDSTANLWLLHTSSNAESQINSECSMKLVHEATFSHHSGKNLWAYAVVDEEDGSRIVATGGADGRVVAYQIPSSNKPFNVSSHQFTLTDALDSTKTLETGNSPTENVLKTFKEKLFDAMIGRWKLSRAIKSALPTHPSGKFEGSANLVLRDTTDSLYDQECIYSEQGDFTTDTGFTMKANRQYVYRYQKKSDEISIWFTKPEGELVDYLFHKLDFEGDTFGKCSPDRESGDGQIMASGQHFCKPDTYYPEYEFRLESTALSSWQIQYTVKGPQKDYVSKATYTPESSPKEMTGPKGISEASKSANNNPITDMLKHDRFKSYIWVGENELIATTERGNLMLGQVLQRDNEKKLNEASSNMTIKKETTLKWEFAGYCSRLRSRSLMSNVTLSDIILLTGSDGVVFTYCNTTRQLTVLYEGAEKLGYLAAQRLEDFGEDVREESSNMCFVARSLGSKFSEIYFLNAEDSTKSLKLASRVTFESEKQDVCSKPDFITSSSLYLKDKGLLLEGSRNGDLRIRRSFTSQLWKFSEVHGIDAITAIRHLPPKHLEHRIYFLTAGRNGKYAYHKLSFNPVQPSSAKFTTIHIASPQFGPNIEGVHFDSITGHLILWGFSSTCFIVWNESMQLEVMSVECGGAHRSWDYIHHNNTGGGSFVWNKASICNVYRQPQPLHQVLQHGGHGREIKAAAISPLQLADSTGKHTMLIATGAEDTMIRLFIYSVGRFKCVSRLTAHTTGVQTLRWSSDSRWLFSAGGCEEFFAWRVRWLSALPCIVCNARCPQVTDQKDLRIMDFAIEEIPPVSLINKSHPDYVISIAYSNSSVRVYSFSSQKARTDEGTNRFTLLSSASYGTSCLTQVHPLCFDDRKVLCTASSNGHLALWHHSNLPDKAFTILQQHAVHQSSIKSLLTINLFDTARLAPNDAERQTPAHKSLLIIAGGDDQALALTRLTYTPTIDEDSKAHPTFYLTTLLIPNAHASAITGIAALDKSEENGSYRFATVGNDQRLKIWGLIFDGTKDGIEAVRIRKIRDVYTGVADASSLEGYEDQAGVWRVLAAGIGMESWKVDESSCS